MEKILLFAAVVAFTVGAPTAKESGNLTSYEELLRQIYGNDVQSYANEKLFGGNESLWETDSVFTSISNYWGVKNETLKWRDGFRIKIDSAFSYRDQDMIIKVFNYVCNILEGCIKCELLTSLYTWGNYVFVTKANEGCYSAVGRTGGQQELNLETPGCMHSATILHELMHALGVFHEHTRSDRDDYVTVHFKNIKSGKKGNFEIQYDAKAYGTEYEYQSIMHYPGNGFSSNGEPTITAKDGRKVGNLNNRPTASDIKKLRNMYC